MIESFSRLTQAGPGSPRRATVQAAASGLGSADDQVFSRLLENRIVFLGSVVEDAVANAISAKLLLLAAEDPAADIYLYINSPGGSVSAGMAIYDTMQYVGNDVATVALGLAGSMGQFLLCAGTAGKRYALPHARIMMHQPHGGIGGTAADISIQAEQMLYTKRTLQERIAFHTGQTVEQIETDSDRDRWFTAEEAKEYGLVDHVVVRADQVPSVVSGAGMGLRRAGRTGFGPGGGSGR
ncbi:ATP-dependent Clp protease proteolytic subunit [Frankia sp. CcI156]|uniref:ATP-dependent Clp protease proteolytic subunit 4 n=1 Tax=Frankia casuarinae (strain DSM 45818 / CECT 9043 / HFP020203 / CcI3) TaxID=106370 RepID=CLPP4_FRACC|nr:MULTISPECIES: ATP-dependent Clp protease proteolytic subunit [Frankia]Q2J9A8.1 RecName: Full=ATP-dependent Clp protease proteolytic subunit 4; AltName: Full=Endopeptidase Clp 4 [Frankia casuarinae]ABD12134.1 ATP-dependent Clp protease proteolytic subunit ClpP / ClpP1 peptidase. Serine peptidase. MEROPS family S14 [Frankia casuarinae]ESZ99656.1 ATP-dependent Clp protease proteolytic subunit ClpP [Frankia sp. CcI6]EYT89525.1 ATP-dependent Clp protease proteolytic subunit ClpP [Frankia casuarin